MLQGPTDMRPQDSQTPTTNRQAFLLARLELSGKTFWRGVVAQQYECT